MGPDIGIKRAGNNYIITDRNTLTVIWNGFHRLSITVTPEFAQNIIGMCGNNNGRPLDDIQTKGGDVIDLEQYSIEDFAHTWEVTNSCHPEFILP
ncbi:BMP-binding endothelial regulator protein-like [Saccoglossus kowalevskii]